MQDDDGKWGCFHSLSQFYDAPITTEQALRRLERLGYTMEDACIQKAVSYMDACLTGNQVIPDRREKTHDWDLFTAMILSTWIRRFTPNNENANSIAKSWACIVARAFADGTYSHKEYAAAFYDTWGIPPKGGRFTDFVSFYPVSMLRGCLDLQTEASLLNHILNKPNGIYYVYDKKLSQLPSCFMSREASRYLGALELLAEYPSAGNNLKFAADWLTEQKAPDGTWDMGSTVKDHVYFPLSDDWRKKEARVSDCTERIDALLRKLTV